MVVPLQVREDGLPDVVLFSAAMSVEEYAFRQPMGGLFLLLKVSSLWKLF